MADAFFKPVSGDQRADAEFSGAANLAGQAGRLLAHRSSCPADTHINVGGKKVLITRWAIQVSSLPDDNCQPAALPKRDE